MLAEIAAANAAFGVIKEALSNGGEIYAVGKQMAEFFDAKAQIEKTANAKGKGTEAFFAREQLRQKEAEFLEMLVYQGRPGLIDDWWKFQAERKKEREAEIRAIKAKVQRRKDMLYNVLISILVFIAGVTGFGLVAVMVYVVMRGKM